MSAEPRLWIERHWAFLALLVGLAWLYVTTLDAHGMFIWDEAEYALLGRSILRGEEYGSALRPPLLPLSAALSMLLTQSHADEAIKSLQVPFALLGVATLYGCVTAAFDRRAGLAAAAFLGLSPSFWLQTSYLLSEVPFIAFFTGAVFFFYFGLVRSPRLFYASWLCASLALLTRYTLVLFGPIALILTAWALASRPETRPRVFSRHFWLAPFVGLACFAPWLIRQQLAHGDALVGFKLASRQVGAFAPHLDMPWFYYPANLPGMVTWPVLLLAIAGVAWGVRRSSGFVGCNVIVISFLLVWFSFYRYKEVRFVTAALPFLAALASVGLTRQLAELRPWFGSQASVAAVACALAALVYWTTSPNIVGMVANGYPAFRDAMAFVDERAGREDVIVGSSGPQLRWYLDRPFMRMPRNEPLSASSLNGADWVFVVNFEPGQPAHAVDLARLFGKEELGQGQIWGFQDARNGVVVIRGDALAERLSTDAK